MDRNTVTGLVLIGLLLTVFAIFNQPSEEEQRKMKEKARKERVAQAAKEKEKADKKKVEKEVKTIEANWIEKLDEAGNPVPADSGFVVYTDTTGARPDTSIAMTPVKEVIPEAKEKQASRPKVKDSLLTLESDRLLVTFNAKGGTLASVKLKEFESYQDFAKNDGKVSGLTLFEAGDATNELILTKNGKKIMTSYLAFDIAKYDSAGQNIVFEHRGQEDELIRFSYQLKDGQYDLGYDIKIEGYGGKVSPQNVLLQWKAKYRQTERLMSEQRRVSTVCFNYKEEGFSYLDH
jgi:YidC/Oxa1 family membrane protein insertase